MQSDRSSRPSGVQRKYAEGIQIRHSADCSLSSGAAKCNCDPTYWASVYDPRHGKRIYKRFGSPADAKLWRGDALNQLARGTLRAPSKLTLRQAADEWLEGARNGSILTRSGTRYKPSSLRGYDEALRLRVLPEYGSVKLTDLQAPDLYRFTERLQGQGLDGSTIRNTIMPLRAIYSRAVARGDVAVNPTTGLRLPTARGKRDRIATPAEAERLLAALPEPERALWATAFYAGLRRGELAALRWSDVDLANGTIRVEQGWDRVEGEIDPKSKAGRRTVPIPAVLRDYLVEHRMAHEPSGLVFGRTATKPFDPSGVASRAKRAWKAAGLLTLAIDSKLAIAPRAIGLHECRHTYASLMIAAGVNFKALSTYMGHANISITLDRYGHLMPGNEDEAAGLLDAYLERANTSARRAAVAA